MSRRDPKEKIELFADWIVESQRPVAFTGAGISTDSGIPDYRGPDGVWTRKDRGLPPPKLKVPREQVEPNAGHMALVELQRLGKLWFLISQNVDDLHRKSGVDPSRLAELHGNRAIMKCLRCDRRFERSELGWTEEEWGKGYRGEPPMRGQPKCPCGGRIVSSIVNFGDAMPDREMRAATYHSQRADLFLVIGSSLAVMPANQMPLYTVRSGGRLVIVNKQETPLDKIAHLVIRDGISEVLPPMVEKVRKRLSSSSEEASSIR
jgi:mono-ADP-ribosyltransferase sirtuin 6